MARLGSALFAVWLGSSLAIACGGDDNGDEHGSAEHGTAEHGTAEHGTGSGGQCADLGSMCHEAGEMMGGMAQVCHDTGHDGDEAACAAIYDECIALCTGATSGGSGSSGAGSTGGTGGGADSSGSGSGSGG